MPCSPKVPGALVGDRHQGYISRIRFHRHIYTWEYRFSMAVKSGEIQAAMFPNSPTMSGLKTDVPRLDKPH